MARSLMVGLLACAAAACVDDAGDGAVRVMRNVALTEDACVVPAQATTGRSGGLLEVTSPSDYLLTPILQNFASSSSGRFTAQRTAFIEGARIDLSFTDPMVFSASELADNASLLRFSTPFSAAVLPDGGTSGVGFSVVPVELLRAIAPKLSASRTRVTINVRAVLYGKMGNGDFESAPFLYPVTVCDYRIGGCVVASAQFACGGIVPEGLEIRKGNPCNAYQDGPADCCNQGTGVVCPGYGMPPPS